MKKINFMILLKNFLLAFALISIGYALGKHSGAPCSSNDSQEVNHKTAIHVYYLHSAFRCSTCNTIEKMTKDFLYSKYKDQLDSGKMLFSEVNFQQNTKLANRFKVVASCVVVAAEKNGKTIDFKRLDEVWTKMENKTSFDKYIEDAVTDMKSQISSGEIK